VVFQSGFDENDKRLEFIKKIFSNWTFVEWEMPKYDSQRELMLSAFVLGIKEFIKTPYFVKLDCDTYFTDDRDVFTEKDLEYDIVGHKWGYTKPGWWISKLDGSKIDLNEGRRNHDRIASFCCLHNTEYVIKIAEKYGKRLPIPSHDTLLWWHSKNWLGKNLKKLGVNNNTNWKKIREAVTSSDSNDNFNDVLTSKVQLEITTDCNLKCHNCDRACGVAPSKEYMGIEHIWKFVEESLKLNKKWTRIDILGGEPTLYPHLPQLWSFLKLYKLKNPDCQVRFSTNGINKIDVPDWVKVRNSKKTGRDQKHTAFNSAPVDHGEDVKSCSVPWRCGTSLSRHGYFLCGAGAAIARVFGIDIGIKNLRDVTSDALRGQIDELCKYCGHSQVESRHMAKGQEISYSWKKALKSYKKVRLGEY